MSNRRCPTDCAHCFPIFAKMPVDHFPTLMWSSPRKTGENSLLEDMDLKMTMLSFILAHEFGHALMRMDDPGIQPVRESLDALHLDIPNENQKAELVADCYAAPIAHSAYSHFEKENNIEGESRFFGAAQIMAVSYLSAMKHLMTVCEVTAEDMEVDVRSRDPSCDRTKQVEYIDQVSSYPVGQLRYEALMKTYGTHLTPMEVRLSEMSQMFWIISLFNASESDLKLLNPSIHLLSVIRSAEADIHRSTSG